MSLSIYHYQCPSLFIKDSWELKRKKNKNFSLRSWARVLGISSHGTFYQIVQGKRSLPKKYVQSLSKSLGLSSKESYYLETLIDFAKAKTIEQKDFYYKRLIDIAPTHDRLSFYEIESYHFLKDPINGALVEMTMLEDFDSDPQWIRDRISIDISEREISNKLERLVELKLLERDGDVLKRTNEHLYTKQDVKNEALQEYHRNILKIGAQQISKQDVSKREYNASAFGIKSTDLPDIKNDIREFMKKTIAKYEVESSDEIYQLGIQFFGLTNISHKGENDDN